MDMIIPPLKLKIMLESNPLKSRILVRRLAVLRHAPVARTPAHVRCACTGTQPPREAQISELRNLNIS